MGQDARMACPLSPAQGGGGSLHGAVQAVGCRARTPRNCAGRSHAALRMALILDRLLRCGVRRPTPGRRPCCLIRRFCRLLQISQSCQARSRQDLTRCFRERLQRGANSSAWAQSCDVSPLVPILTVCSNRRDVTTECCEMTGTTYLWNRVNEHTMTDGLARSFRRQCGRSRIRVGN